MQTTHINDRRLTPSTIEERIASASAYASTHAHEGDINGRAHLFIAAVTGFFGAHVPRGCSDQSEAA